jgi:peptide/nickel transport system substrate-binding protein
MLDALVEAGDLPPVVERLPANPLVYSAEVNALEKGTSDFTVGEYGGVLRMIRTEQHIGLEVQQGMHEGLIERPGPNAAPGNPNETISGGIAEEFEMSEDQKVFTFHLRQGLRWSDGVPVTTEDVRFAFEDVLKNELLTAAFPIDLRGGREGDGAIPELTIIDENTFSLTYPEPYPGLLNFFSYQDLFADYSWILKPKHYLQQFHADYTPEEELTAMAEEAGLPASEWPNLFISKDWDVSPIVAASQAIIDMPTLRPFIVTSIEPSTVMLERNPYYWKVDEEGNQLPYVDTIRSFRVENAETAHVAMLAGEVDYNYLRTQVQNMPLYEQFAESNNFQYLPLDVHRANMVYTFNQTFEDPVWREVVRDVRFRKAVSHAINRQEINDSVYLGTADEVTLVPSEYDPDLANRLLDEMGLDQRDADGWRLGPDGNRFVVPIRDHVHEASQSMINQLAVEHLKDVGLFTVLRQVDFALYEEMEQGNRLEINAQRMHVGVLAYARNYRESLWGNRLWEIWYETGGEQGEEPPEWAQRLQQLALDMWLGNPEDAPAAFEAWKELWYEQLPGIQLVQNVPTIVIANADLRNLPHSGFAITGSFGLEQYYFAEE